MNGIKKFMLRGYYKLLRNLPGTQDTLLSIQGGPLKGLQFNLNIGTEYLLGSYELDSLELILDKIGPNDVVYDLGANAGYYAMAMAQKTKQKIYAFEPMPVNIERLKKHLNVNSVGNVEIKAMAISDHSGEIEFSNVASLVGNTYVQSSPHFEETSNTFKVPTNSIDNLVFGNEKLKPPNIIKIDVEGAEFDVLKGAERTIKEFRPILLLATHDVHLPGVKKDCLEFLDKMKYKVTPTDVAKSVKQLEDFIAFPEN